MSKQTNKPDFGRIERKGWKRKAENVLSANHNLLGFLYQARQDLKAIRSLAVDVIADSRLVIIPSRRKAIDALQQIVAKTDKWELAEIVKKNPKDAATGGIDKSSIDTTSGM